jgi:hypothetical protein
MHRSTYSFLSNCSDCSHIASTLQHHNNARRQHKMDGVGSHERMKRGIKFQGKKLQISRHRHRSARTRWYPGVLRPRQTQNADVAVAAAAAAQCLRSQVNTPTQKNRDVDFSALKERNEKTPRNASIQSQVETIIQTISSVKSCHPKLTHSLAHSLTPQKNFLKKLPRLPAPALPSTAGRPSHVRTGWSSYTGLA